MTLDSASTWSRAKLRLNLARVQVEVRALSVRGFVPVATTAATTPFRVQGLGLRVWGCSLQVRFTGVEGVACTCTQRSQLKHALALLLGRLLLLLLMHTSQYQLRFRV